MDSNKKGQYIIGLMSGTSLDGIDIAYCHFESAHQFRLIAADTIAYDDAWRQRLSTLHTSSAEVYARADAELGHLFGRCVNRFRADHPGRVDAIASHGHTVFHQPEAGFTAQIGDGNAIAAETGLPVVCDFRRLDVALGGQGAPLVPIGDRLLFGDYDCCINLGGIANLSYEQGNHRTAYDISPCNMALNWLAAKAGMDCDRDGKMASEGQFVAPLMEALESLDYYQMEPPKTLGKEWFEGCFRPLVEEFECTPLPDRLRTVTEHIALRIAEALSPAGISIGSALVTGGGAKNKFLMERVKALKPRIRFGECDADIVDYKEAIIFALLAYLRLQGENNTLASVTGARCDSCGGVLCGSLKA